MFEAGTVVTLSGSEQERSSVSVLLSLSEDSTTRLELLDDAYRSVEIGEDGTAEVRFRLKAIKMGDADFKISAGVILESATWIRLGGSRGGGILTCAADAR